MGAPLTMSGRDHSQKTALSASQDVVHHEDFEAAGQPQDPITRLALVVEQLESKVDQGFREVRSQFSTFKVCKRHFDARMSTSHA